MSMSFHIRPPILLLLLCFLQNNPPFMMTFHYLTPYHPSPFPTHPPNLHHQHHTTIPLHPLRLMNPPHHPKFPHLPQPHHHHLNLGCAIILTHPATFSNIMLKPHYLLGPSLRLTRRCLILEILLILYLMSLHMIDYHLHIELLTPLFQLPLSHRHSPKQFVILNGVMPWSKNYMLLRKMALGPSSHFLPARNQLAANGYTKSSLIQMARSSVIKPVWLLRAIARLKVWTIINICSGSQACHCPPFSCRSRHPKLAPSPT